MGLGNGLAGFAKGFAAGYKLLDDAETNKYKRAYMKAQTDNITDPDMRAAKLESQRASAAHARDLIARENSPEALRYKKLINDRLEAMTDLYKRSGQQPPAAPGPVDTLPQNPVAPVARPTPDQSSMAEPDQNFDTSALDTGGAEAGGDSQFAAGGGMIQPQPQKRQAIPVKKYAEGGAVEDDDPEDDGEDDELPENAQQDEGRTSYAAAADGVNAGLKYNMRVNGLDQRAGVPDPTKAVGIRRYLSGAGAAAPQEMDSVYKAIDPKGQMSESERRMAAYGHVWEYYLNKGDLPQAQKAMGAMVQYSRVMSDRYKALAAAAAEHGDLDGALKAAVKGFENVPNGQDLHVVKNKDGSLSYAVTDEATGKMVTKGIANPDQFIQMATKGAASNFDNLILLASGKRNEGGPSDSFKRSMGALDESKTNNTQPNTLSDDDRGAVPIGSSRSQEEVDQMGALPEASGEDLAGMSKDEQKRYQDARKARQAEVGKGARAPKVTDRASGMKQMDEAYTAEVGAMDPKDAEKITKPEENTLKSASYDMFMHPKNNLSQSSAIRASLSIASSGGKSVTMGKDEAEVTLGNGQKVYVPRPAFRDLIAIKAQADKANASKEGDNERSKKRGANFASGMKEAGDGLADTETGKAVSGAVGAAKYVGGKAAEGAGAVVNYGLDKLGARARLLDKGVGITRRAIEGGVDAAKNFGRNVRKAIDDDTSDIYKPPGKR